MRGFHRWPVNSPHKGPVTRKMFPFDDVIMIYIVNIMPADDLPKPETDYLQVEYWQTLYKQMHNVINTLVPVNIYSRSLSTHRGRMRLKCVSKLGHHRLKKWLDDTLAPSHYLNQCWAILNWTLRNKLQWNLSRNSSILIQENKFENVIWKCRAFCLGVNVLTI